MLGKKAILIAASAIFLVGVLLMASEMRKPKPAAGVKDLSGFFGGGTNPTLVVKQFIKLVESGEGPCSLSSYEQISMASRDHSFQSAEEFATSSELVSEFYVIVLCDQNAWPWRKSNQDELLLAAFSSIMKDQIAVYTNHNRWFVVDKVRLNSSAVRKEIGITDDLWASSRNFHVLRQGI